MVTDSPNVTTIQPSDTRPYIDSIIELVCVVSGVDPSDNITWTSGNGTRVFFTEETSGANVTVPILTRSDYGVYTCTATNDYGKGVGIINITMPGMCLFQTRLFNKHFNVVSGVL